MKTKIIIGILSAILITGYILHSQEATSSSNSSVSSLSASQQENIMPEIVRQSKMDLWIDVADYGVRVSIPDRWENNITLRKLPHHGGRPATYGFLLSPKDARVVEQYVGALLIYDASDWNRLNEESKNEEIKLLLLDGKVFTYRNSLFNQYPDLPQAELFDALVLTDEEVRKCIRIEKVRRGS